MSDKQERDFVSQYAGLPPRDPREGPTGEYKAFGPTPAPKQPPPMIDVRHASGQRRGIAYGYLVEPVYTPDTLISLTTTHSTVTIEGRNLEPVFDALLQHKLGFVQEWSAARFDPPEEDAPVITKITRKGLFDGTGGGNA